MGKGGKDRARLNAHHVMLTPSPSFPLPLQVGFPLFLNDVSILRYVRHPSARLLFDSRDLHRSGEEEEGGGRGGGGGEGGEGEGGGGGGGGERGSLVAFDFTDGEDALRACLLLSLIHI